MWGPIYIKRGEGCSPGPLFFFLYTLHIHINKNKNCSNTSNKEHFAHYIYIYYWHMVRTLSNANHRCSFSITALFIICYCVLCTFLNIRSNKNTLKASKIAIYKKYCAFSWKDAVFYSSIIYIIFPLKGLEFVQLLILIGQFYY